MFLFFLQQFGTCDICGSDAYSPNIEICCNSSNKYWVCRNDEWCIDGGHCFPKGSRIKDVEVIYAFWFFLLILQAIICIYIIYLFGWDSIKSLSFVIVMQFILSFATFTFILSLVYAIRHHQYLFLVLTFFSAIGIGCITSIWSLGFERNDISYVTLNETIEKNLNEFIGKKGNNKRWRSTLSVISDIPKSPIINLELEVYIFDSEIASSFKMHSTTKQHLFLEKKLLFDIYIFINSLPKLPLIALFAFGQLIPKLFLDNIFEEKDCYEYCKIVIIQKVTNSVDDPLYPYKTNENGMYKAKDFINYTFGFSDSDNLSIILNKKYEDEGDKESLEPLNPNEEPMELE